MPHSKNIIWADCEMTGLDLAKDELLEIAVVATDSDLQPFNGGIDLLIAPSDAALAGMKDIVRKMHTDSGLLSELAQGAGEPIAEVEQKVLQYIQKYVPQADTAPLAGNTIGTDRMFISRFMPQVDEYLHYRSIDVSSLKELARRWYPRIYYHTPDKRVGHRALADILESIRELHYYRHSLIVSGDGPTSDECKEASADSTAEYAKYFEG